MVRSSVVTQGAVVLGFMSHEARRRWVCMGCRLPYCAFWSHLARPWPRCAFGAAGRARVPVYPCASESPAHCVSIVFSRVLAIVRSLPPRFVVVLLSYLFVYRNPFSLSGLSMNPLIRISACRPCGSPRNAQRLRKYSTSTYYWQPQLLLPSH